MPNPAADETRVMQRKGRTFLLILGACAFVALGFWLMFLDDATIRSLHRHSQPLVARGIGLVSVLFFGACVVKGVGELFNREPGLVLNGSGLLDNSSSGSVGLVPWSDIVDVGTFRIRNQEMVVVKVRNPQEYVRRGSTIRQALNKANQNLCGSPIAIVPGKLGMHTPELLSLVERYRQKYGKS